MYFLWQNIYHYYLKENIHHLEMTCSISNEINETAHHMNEKKNKPNPKRIYNKRHNINTYRIIKFSFMVEVIVFSDVKIIPKVLQNKRIGFM